MSLAIVLAAVWAFVFGVHDLARRVAREAPRTGDAVALGAYAALGVVAVTVALMMVGIRSIPAAQVLTVGVIAWGVVRAGARVPELWRWANAVRAEEFARRAIIGAAMAWTVVFWSGIFRSHVALPVAQDGIVHTAFYLRIIEAGVPTLGRVPIGFAGLFGIQLFPFYPTGTHTLLALVVGFLGEWGLVSHAGLLKASFTLTVAALPWALYWFLRRITPATPWWVGLAVTVAAIPGFRFPIEAAHEGGASRLIAHLVMMPVYAEAVLGRFDSFRRRTVAGMLLGIAFLMHPSTFVTLAALLAYSTIAAVYEERGVRAAARCFGGLGLSLGIGGGVIAAVLFWNGAVAEARDATLPFSWSALGVRWWEGAATLFSLEYGMAPVHPWLVGLGMVLLLVWRRALGVSGRVAGLPFWMTAVALVILATRLIPFPGGRMLGGAFYDEIPRVIEPLFEVVGLCLATAFWGMWRLVASAGDGVRFSVRSGWLRLPTVFAVSVVLAVLGYQIARRPWLVRHIGYWDRQFDTSRIGNLRALGAWIVQYTEPDAVLFHHPFDSEIWEAWTGRRGIFMYGECHANNNLSPCVRRKAFVAEQFDVLQKRMAQPTPEQRCLAPVDAFNRPAYFLVPASPSSARPVSLCVDATLVATLDRHAVIQYRRPVPAPR